MKLFLVASLLLAAPGLLFGRTITVATENFCIDIPDDWTVSSNPGVQIKNAVLFAADQDHSAAIICIYPDLKPTTIDSAFIKELELGMTKSSRTSIVGTAQPIKLNVASTYVISLKTALPESRTIYARCYPFTANGKLYVMSVQSFDQNKNVKLQSIAKSIRFLGSPPISASNN